MIKDFDNVATLLYTITKKANQKQNVKYSELLETLV